MGKWVMLGAYSRHDCLLIASQVLAPNRDVMMITCLEATLGATKSCITLYCKNTVNSDNAHELDMLLSGMIWMVCWSVLLRIWLSYAVLPT